MFAPNILFPSKSIHKPLLNERSQGTYKNIVTFLMSYIRYIQNYAYIWRVIKCYIVKVNVVTIDFRSLRTSFDKLCYVCENFLSTFLYLFFSESTLMCFEFFEIVWFFPGHDGSRFSISNVNICTCHQNEDIRMTYKTINEFLRNVFHFHFAMWWVHISTTWIRHFSPNLIKNKSFNNKHSNILHWMKRRVIIAWRIIELRLTFMRLLINCMGILFSPLDFAILVYKIHDELTKIFRSCCFRTVFSVNEYYSETWMAFTGICWSQNFGT